MVSCVPLLRREKLMLGNTAPTKVPQHGEHMLTVMIAITDEEGKKNTFRAN